MTTRQNSDDYHHEENMWDRWVSGEATGKQTTGLPFALRQQYTDQVIYRSRTERNFRIPRFKVAVLTAAVRRRRENHSFYRQDLQKKLNSHTTDQIDTAQTYNDGHLHAIRQ